MTLTSPPCSSLCNLPIHHMHLSIRIEYFDLWTKLDSATMPTTCRKTKVKVLSPAKSLPNTGLGLIPLVVYILLIVTYGNGLKKMMNAIGRMDLQNRIKWQLSVFDTHRLLG